jgi:hypothetical protein
MFRFIVTKSGRQSKNCGRVVSLFIDEIEDQSYGLVTHFVMPGRVQVQLYQPHYTKGSTS